MAALTEAVFAIDARTGLVNLGTGGSALNPTSGSNPSAADSNDPTYLTWDGTNYLYLPGVAGNYASTPDSAALSITGDIDIRVRVAMDEWMPAADSALVTKYGGAGERSYFFRLEPTGRLRFLWSPDGTTVPSATSNVLAYAPGSAKWVRVTLDVDNGSGGYTVTFYDSDDGATWNIINSVPVSGTTTNIFDSSMPVQLGVFVNSLSPAAGKFYRAQIRNGIDGTVVFDADFTTGITSGAQTSFTESSSNAATVTISRPTSGQKAVAVTRPCWLFGTSKYLEVADNDLLDFGASDSFTVLAAVRQWATPQPTVGYVWKGGYIAGNNGTNYQPRATVTDGVNPPVSVNGVGLAAGSFQSLGILVDRGAQTVRTFGNSTLNTTASISSVGSLANANALRIGRTTTFYQDFELFAVAIWRRALSAAEISAMSTALTNAVLNPTSPDARGLTLNTLPKGLVLN